MGAFIMFALVSAIAIGAFLYYSIKDRKEGRHAGR